MKLQSPDRPLQSWLPPLSRSCIETEALEHLSGHGFGFMREGSCGDVAASFSIADSCSHPCDRGQGLPHLPLGNIGEQELKMQRLSVEHLETDQESDLIHDDSL